MLSTGSLDRRISIERNEWTRDIDGEPIADWERIGSVAWARRAPVAGDERFTAQQFIARDQDKFTVRWRADLADASPGDRIVYPVTTTPADSEIYDIIAVAEMGYREALNFTTARRAETQTQ
jgi:head-tail adaptor